MSKEREALKLALEALEKLWNIIDDIDTYGDMAKDDEKLYRSLVERRQRTRFEETGITTDGYELSGGAITAIKEALAQPEQEPVACLMCKEWEAVCDQHLRHIKKLKKQRTWVGLTDEDIDKLADLHRKEFGQLCDAEDLRMFARAAIEAAHGIKE